MIAEKEQEKRTFFSIGVLKVRMMRNKKISMAGLP